MSLETATVAAVLLFFILLAGGLAVYLWKLHKLRRAFFHDVYHHRIGKSRKK